jgi:hypothetical protein
MREFSGEEVAPFEIINLVLRHSWAKDQSGALSLFALVIVGPRLLVSLRDAFEVVTDQNAPPLRPGPTGHRSPGQAGGRAISESGAFRRTGVAGGGSRAAHFGRFDRKR